MMIEIHEPKIKKTKDRIVIYTEPYSDLLECGTQFHGSGNGGKNV